VNEFTAAPRPARYGYASLSPTGNFHMDSTITEQDLDATAQDFVQSLRDETFGVENDLAVDGLDESLLSRLLSLFGVGSR